MGAGDKFTNKMAATKASNEFSIYCATFCDKTLPIPSQRYYLAYAY